jgi:hypothetical protein
MDVQQILLKEIQDSKMWYAIVKDDNTYKRDLRKRIELINWVLENMKNLDTNICALIETKMIELIDEINKKDSILATRQ